MRYFDFNKLTFNLKKYCASLPYLIIIVCFLTACNNNKSGKSLQVSSPKVSPSDSSSLNSETTNSSSQNTNPSTSSDTSPIVDPEQQFTYGSTEIKLRCGETYNFENFEINSQCPLDEDKDGRPDKSVVTFSFINKSTQYSYLTFQGTVSLLFKSHPSQPNYKNFHYSNAIRRSGFYSTAKINPNQVLKIDRTLRTVNDKFAFNLGIGKVKIDSSESKIVTLKCPDYGVVRGDKVYGVIFKLYCSSRHATLHFNNYATQARGVVIKQVQRGISWVYSQPNFEPSPYAHGGLTVKVLRSSEQKAGSYKAEILYQDNNK